MRSGADYRDSLRDGRQVFVMGEGRVADVTTHPATRPMVDDYVAWYDRHRDPDWQDRLLLPADAAGVRGAAGFLVPHDADDLTRMGRCFAATVFLSAGNVTHTPAYGHLIAMGIRHAVGLRNANPRQGALAEAYRAHIAATGRFLTFASGAAPIGHRLREDPADRTAMRAVRQTDAGIVVSGRIGMHTSPAYAEDVYIGAYNGIEIEGHRASFIVPVGTPGVTVLCRRRSVRDDQAPQAPLSARYDELDGQMWLEEVFVPWERVFLTDASPEPIARWLFWHQLYCWLAKAEFTLGLALACAHAMGLAAHAETIEHIVDLMVEVQTVRTCLVAAERDPERTAEGWASPNHAHLAAGSLSLLRARPRMGEILRILPGSSLIVAPTARDLEEPALRAGLDQAFGGGGYTARQRAALLELAWDHVGSALDHRESVYELHANGGMPIWRHRLRRAFADCNALANGVLAQLPLAMPAIDVGAIRAAPIAPRRVVAPGGAAPR